MANSDAIEYLISEGWKQKEPSSEDWRMEMESLGEDEFLVDNFVPNILIFKHNTEFQNDPLYLDGTFILQDKASCLPALALKPRRGRKIMDACAAPGMKTSYIAGMTENENPIVAIEKSKKRFDTLQEMLQKYEADKMVTFKNQDFTDIDPLDPEYEDIEYILLDSPCSGSGMYSRLETQLRKNSEEQQNRVYALSFLQKKLLVHAMKFPQVKRIVYSTCSLHPEENEDVIAFALNSDHSFSIKNALPNWPYRVQNNNYEWANFCARSNYEENLTDGFFVSVLERGKKGKK